MRISRIVDLSWPLDDDTWTYPGDPPVRLTQHSTVDADGFHLLAVSMGSQSGTHADAPYHVDAEAPRLEAVPLDRFLCPAVVLDVTDAGPRDLVGPERVEPLLDGLDPGTAVLLHTGWSRLYRTPAYLDHPGLDPEAARLLMEAGVRTIGIDAPSIDVTGDTSGLAAHRVVAAADGVVLENLRGLDGLDWPVVWLSATPIALTGADGAPVRAIAFELSP